MKDQTKLCDTLNTVFSNQNFIEEIATNKEMNFIAAITLVLKYYIATRDTNTHYSLKEIQKRFEDFLKNNGKKAVENTIKHGYLAHALNGYKIPRLKKYGLDYEGKSEFAGEIEFTRQAVNRLEELLGKSRYRIKEEKNNNSIKIDQNTVFMCAPGKEVVGFALKFAPERLYAGPLSGEIGVIVGETKAQHYYRLLEKKLRIKFKNNNPELYKEGLELAKQIVDFYCTKRPGIALIEIDKILDVTLWEGFIGRDPISMRDYISNWDLRIHDIALRHFYEDNPAGFGGGNLYDLVTFPSEIPKEAVSVFELMDFFELFQLKLKLEGFPLGTKFNDFDGEEINDYDNYELVTIGEMRGIVGNFTSIDDLEELKKQAVKRKSIVLSELEKSKKIMNEFGMNFNNIEELKKLYNDLIEKEETILDRPYPIRNGIRQIESLRDVIEHFKKDGTFDEILEEDRIIKEDEHQFKGDLYGVNHTRRVSFYLNLLSRYNVLDSDEKKILFYVILNYNIGKTCDEKDEKDGILSVEKMMRLGDNRLEGLSDEDKTIVKFMIEQYYIQDDCKNFNSLPRMDEVLRRKEQLKLIGYLSDNSLLSKNHIKDMISEIYPEILDIESLTDEQVSKIYKKAADELTQLEMKYPYPDMLPNRNRIFIRRMYTIFSDADYIDRVRFFQGESSIKDKFDNHRFFFPLDQSIEGLAYECLDKLIEVLDIEHAKKEIKHYLELNNELDEEVEIEKEIESQKENCRKIKNKHIEEFAYLSIHNPDINGFLSNVTALFGGGKTEKSNNEENKKGIKEGDKEDPNIQ